MWLASSVSSQYVIKQIQNITNAQIKIIHQHTFVLLDSFTIYFNVFVATSDNDGHEMLDLAAMNTTPA